MAITILHLSDLQFGRHHADDSGNRPPLYELSRYDVEIQKIISDLKLFSKDGIKPSYIVLSGDIAEESLPAEYDIAAKFIDEIISFFSISKKNVIIVPGNHDINRALCQSARLRAKAFGTEFRRPYFEKFEVYSNFFNNYYNDIEWNENETRYSFKANKLYNLFLFSDQKVAFIGLNSCIDESEIDPHYGNITVEQCKKAFEDLNVIDNNLTYRRIVVLHHNFVRASSNDEENLKDADDILAVLIENNVSLILHGHQHISKNQTVGIGDNIISVLATGSAGLDSITLPENCRRYQIIVLNENKFRIYRRRFDYKHTYLDGKGCWVPDILPDERQIYAEFEIPSKATKITKHSTNDYDLYKIRATDNALRGRDILVLAYPRREIELIDRVLDHKNKIYYEYLSVKIELNSSMYFLFVGKHINIKATTNYFLTNNRLPTTGLTICSPRVMSKGDGGSEFRAKNIKDTVSQIIHDRNKIATYAIDVHYIDDYVWQSCLDLSFRKNKFIVTELPYFIDQQIYQLESDRETNLGLSLPYFEDMLDRQYDEGLSSNPIAIILASGGMGKSTLCDKLTNMINNYEKKKAVYINAEDIKAKLEFISYEIKTISDLIRAYDAANGSKHLSLHDPNSLEINISCGNVVVIIDGLDEIESALMDKFDIDNFLDSIVNIDNYFNNCRLIITSRDYHKEKYRGKNGIALYYLKGFEHKNVEQYFNKRFNSDALYVDKSVDYVKKLNIRTDDHYMPLFLTLIADIVQRESATGTSSTSQFLNTELLKPQFILDDLVVRLIDREIHKQQLGISIDQFIDLLNEIVITKSGNMTIDDFHDYVDICLPRNIGNVSDKDIHTKYHINPLFKIADGKVQLKYDVLSILVKTRYIQNCIAKKDFKDNMVPLIAENCYGSGTIIEELLLPQNVNSISISALSVMITFLIKKLNSSSSKEDRESAQKAISFAIHLAFKMVNPHDKKDRTVLLTSLYKDDLRYLFIYGSFYPLSYEGLKIYDSQFVGYDNLFNSTFPADDTVFYYCSFIDLQLNKSKVIPKSVFDDTCTMPIELRNYFAASSETTKQHYFLIKSDLKKYFKSFVASNVFHECSLNRMNSVFMTKFDRKVLIEEMMYKGIMNMREHRGNRLYSIDIQYQPSILALINQNNLDPGLEEFCDSLMSKYYKL